MKNKRNIIAVIVILIIIIVTFAALYIKRTQDNTLYVIDESGNKVALESFDTRLANTSHIIINGILNNDNYTNAKYTTIYTFDEKNVVIIQRNIYEFTTEEEAQSYYQEKSKYIGTSEFNLSINDKVVAYNTVSAKLTKEKIIELCSPDKNNTVTEMYMY